MYEVKDTVCCGCLSTDRQVLVIEDRPSKQCFFQIISEMSMLYMSDEQLKLCWECERYIRKWTKFKNQIKHAYKLMHDFATTEYYSKQTLSSLTCKNLYSYTFSPSEDEVDVLQIKREEDNYSYKDLSRNYLYIKDSYDSNYSDIFLPKNGDILSKTDNCQLNGICQPSSQNKEEENNGKEFNNDSDVSDNDILTSNYDVSVSKDDSEIAGKEKQVKIPLVDDSDNEPLMRLSKTNDEMDKREKRDHFHNKVNTKKERKSKKKTKFYKEVRLSKEELKKERGLAEMRDDYINAMFRCERCIISFPNADDLVDHVTLKHDMHATKHKCSLCECSFGSVVSFNYHKKRHRIRYECVICFERFNTTRAVVKHREMAHWLSTDANLEFNSYEKTEKTEDKNVDRENEGERFPCEFCEKTFKWKTSLRKHLETHRIENGQKRKPYCEPCRLSFSTTSNLQKHVKSSSNHQIQLKLIKLKATNSEEPPNPEKQARIEQIKTSVMKSTQRYRCPHCDRMFQWRGNLHRHMANHAARASGELVCKPCDRTFSSIETYNQHMRISKKHVSENVFKFVCSDCGKRFSNKIKLKDHIDWDHLKNYVHVCTDCDKVFKSRTSLLLHSRAVHRKDGMDHLCDHCGKAFPNHGKLRSHIVALHMNETPYKCGICPAKFNWQACLSRHLKKVHGAGRKQKQEGPS